MKFPWKDTDYGTELIVPCKTHFPDDKSSYEIRIAKRPHYCDRGDWMIYVDGWNDLDGADGVPSLLFWHLR